VHTSAKGVASHDYPIGTPAEAAEALLAQFDQLWGTEAMAAMLVPSRAGDGRFRRWFAKAQRTSVRRRAAQPFVRAMLEVDVRPILPLVQAPTLILHRCDVQFLSVEQGRYLAEHIPGAKLVELPGADATLAWEAPELALDLIQQFLTGVHRTAEPTRVLATVLFSDIVASTQRASRLGDRRWRQLLNVHGELARRLVKEFGGRLVKTTGDGLLATFDGPGRGIRCAAALRDELGGIGVPIRVGLHTGEVELRHGDVGGIAVHIAARVMAAAEPGDPRLQDRAGPDRGLRPRPGGPRHPPVAGHRGYLAAVRGGGALTMPPATGHVPVRWAGEPGVPTFRSGAGGAARPDADGGVLEPRRVLDCHLDLVLDPVEDAEPAGVRNQAPQVSNQLRDGPLVQLRVSCWHISWP
jgi:hypothetical protein